MPFPVIPCPVRDKRAQNARTLATSIVTVALSYNGRADLTAGTGQDRSRNLSGQGEFSYDLCIASCDAQAKQRHTRQSEPKYVSSPSRQARVRHGDGGRGRRQPLDTSTRHRAQGEEDHRHAPSRARRPRRAGPPIEPEESPQGFTRNGRRQCICMCSRVPDATSGLAAVRPISQKTALSGQAATLMLPISATRHL
jgi:hypothetical protein